jgi:hypothetical protein
MKLNLNRSETRTLLKLLYMAEHVLASGAEGAPDAFIQKYDVLMARLLEAAREDGLDDFIEEETDGSLHLSPDIEDEPGVLDTIHEHEETLFWRELVERLAERDYELNTGESPFPRDLETWQEATEDKAAETEEELERLESSYWSEFEKHGVRNIHVVRGTGHPS